MAPRLKAMGSAKYQRDGNPRTSGPGFGLTVHPDVVDAPMGWHKPARVFVNSTSDLFHPRVPDEFIARVFGVMAATPRHTYQVLTKRHGRMRSLLNSGEFFQFVLDEAVEGCGLPGVPWPLPNVWLGVSVEDQHHAQLRVPVLLDTDAAVRFVSCEPLLGQVDLASWFPRPLLACARCDPGGALDDDRDHLWGLCGCACHEGREPGRPYLDWVIVGGESGAGARPMALGWARLLVRQCRRAEVPVFVKQLGSVWADGKGRGGKGNEPAVWPADLWVRQFPTVRAEAVR